MEKKTKDRGHDQDLLIHNVDLIKTREQCSTYIEEL